MKSRQEVEYLLTRKRVLVMCHWISVEDGITFWVLREDEAKVGMGFEGVGTVVRGQIDRVLAMLAMIDRDDLPRYACDQYACEAIVEHKPSAKLLGILAKLSLEGAL